MQQSELSPITSHVASRPPPIAPVGEVAEPRRPSAPRSKTVRVHASGGDAVLLVATTALVVSAAFLENAADGAAGWLGVAGAALVVVLLARAFRGAPARAREGNGA